jgi:uncharacterized protein
MTGPDCPRQRSARHLRWLGLLLLSCNMATHAAGFDCGRARTSVEKLICGNERVAEQDSKLNAAYQAVRDASNKTEKRALLAEQRKWLAIARNVCNDIPCLQVAYSGRLRELDPAADQHLTCEEMRTHPVRAFASPIDLGSGYNSPVRVDRCPESLERQEFMRNILTIAEQIRSSRPGFCTGSIVSARTRYYQYDLARAGFHPRSLEPFPARNATGRNWKYISAADAGSSEPSVFWYFRQWSEASRANHQLYSRFAAEFDRVLPMLVRHYRKSMRLSRTDATRAAKSALKLVVDRAAGSFPRARFRDDSDLVERVRSGRFRPREADGLENRYTVAQLREALAVALVHQAPLPVVQALAGKLDLSDPSRFEPAGESLLSLAIGDSRNLEYLLQQAYPVDHANEFGKTALFYAIGESRHKMVQLLLAHGADVNHAYKSARELRPDGNECTYPDLRHTRRTPLMHAAQNSDLAMVKLLVEAHANTTATDELGFNALDYAAVGKNKAAEAFLISMGMDYSKARDF